MKKTATIRNSISVIIDIVFQGASYKKFIKKTNIREIFFSTIVNNFFLMIND